MLSREEIQEIRKDFPFLDIEVPGGKLVYLDNAATTQKPQIVIDALSDFYAHKTGNPHRGAHQLAMTATDVFEGARARAAEFINAKQPEEIVFTRNATESLNILAYSWGLENLKEGDEILISILEHHANLVTWQYVAEKTGAKLVYLYIDEDMQIPWEEFENKINKNTKIFSITQSSNVVGTMPKVKEMIEEARRVSPEVTCIVDGAQSVPHMSVDVQDLDADFLAFSGHKMMAAMGAGVLYGKFDKLNAMKPFLYGGDMIEYVYEDHSKFLEAPNRFEAGTPDVGSVSTLPVAMDYLEKIGLDRIFEYESYLTTHAYNKMKEMDDIVVYTTSVDHRGPVLDFNFKEAHPHDVASILDSKGVAIRSGHHCAQPLHRFLENNSSCRASFAVYNTIEEVDYFLESLDEVRRLMQLGS